MDFEVVIVGGGHAGTEAALASARMGRRTLLLTQSVETLGAMSCNPAIGGIGKGHLVREIDAMGGAMARAADLAGIQFRTLNASKGPAVRATRAQADRSLYRQAIRSMLESQPNLSIFQQEAADLEIEGGRVRGVTTISGITFTARAVVLTVGTFLGGRIHVGLEQHAGGRAGDPPSNRLAAKLRELALPVGRLKTGTPPRIDGRTIDYSRLAPQWSDDPRPVFSFLGRASGHPEQRPCHITATNERTHEIIRAASDRSPMYTGVIEGVGPRYCPSVEDKVVRFAGKSSHQVFLEPEGLHTHEVYPNGISTSLPFDVQVDLVHSIAGLERAHLTRPGYAIEYDYFDPRGLHPSLRTKAIEGLWFAGQINGTTGYEEAAAQGLVAGINAARSVREEEAWLPRREESYIGVLVDDLVTRGVTEPYRMFTSRAEHRLALREDNADLRLTPLARGMGLVDDERWTLLEAKAAGTQAEIGRLQRVRVQGASAFDLLRRPEYDYAAVIGLAGAPDSSIADDRVVREIAMQVTVSAKYAGYIERQAQEVERQRRHLDTRLPADFDYSRIAGLSNEARQRFAEVQPATLGQAARIPGITPAAVSLLLIHLKRRDRAA